MECGIPNMAGVRSQGTTELQEEEHMENIIFFRLSYPLIRKKSWLTLGLLWSMLAAKAGSL
jgi:hypothetical protein